MSRGLRSFVPYVSFQHPLFLGKAVCPKGSSFSKDDRFPKGSSSSIFVATDGCYWQEDPGLGQGCFRRRSATHTSASTALSGAIPTDSCGHIIFRFQANGSNTHLTCHHRIHQRTEPRGVSVYVLTVTHATHSSICFRRAR